MVDEEKRDEEEQGEEEPSEEGEGEGEPFEEEQPHDTQVLRPPTVDVTLDTEALIPAIRQDYGVGLGMGPTLQFRPVPAPEGQRELPSAWRILLVPTDVKQPTIALYVWGDTVIGRGPEVDIDLTAYGGEEKGVSRRHARFRPSWSALYLMDLKSTNGTQLNGILVGPGRAAKLSHDDMLAFGSLHFTLHILTRPEDLPAGGKEAGHKPG